MLVQQFTSTDSVRYEDFAKIWRDMNMTCSMCGRIANQEPRLVIDFKNFLIFQPHVTLFLI